jgi:PAS domain S-box-containing protein
MSGITQKFKITSENQWRLIILAMIGFILVFSLYCLVTGITTVFTHLYYFPIILLAYHYQKKGIFYAELLSLAYLVMTLYFQYSDVIEVLSAFLRVVSFITIAVVIASFSVILKKRHLAYQSVSRFNESIITNANVWLTVLDAKGTILVWNKAAEEISGYTAEAVLGKNILWKQIYPDTDYRKTITRTINYVIRENRFFEHFDTEIQAKNGEKKTISWNTRAVPDEQGSLNRFVAIGIDISERKRSEDELRRTTEELHAAYEQLTAAEEELRQNFDDLTRNQQALDHARKKLNLLNTVTFQDIRNEVFSLSGYIELAKGAATDENLRHYREKQLSIVQAITESLKFANYYQNLGLTPPQWQNVTHSFLLGISHLDISKLSRIMEVDGLEIYADSLLENVFFNLAENVLLYGQKATTISLRCRETPEGITLIFEDDGAGVADDKKEKIFERKYGKKNGMGLLLTREILEVTGITIRETGTEGKGARFEMAVPKEGYRFAGAEGR